ncbi:glutamic acid-rich protein-like [Podarcis raffonei]|uniref:glutamic acid-rich protein-like n=1 Tax=Podarcis raffonei TaxID=65483 RepID=UPI002329408F|nr:glutamic acid-rich protein-like [Podarcis raffonei]
MSHSQKKGGEGATPGERRELKQEIEPKADIVKMLTEIKKDIKQSEKNLETRLEQMDKKIDMTVNELKGQMKELTKRTQSLEEGLKRTKLEMREVKREEEEMRAEVLEINKTQEDIWDAIAMNDLRQREQNLRLRSMPEVQGENLREKLTLEIAQWLGMEVEEVRKTIQNVFRIKTRSAKAKKFPGDCLIIFKHTEIKNLILQKNREKRLIIIIDGNFIIIFRDVPLRLLKKRDHYKPLTQILRKNQIEFKWEFPEGISFFYKGKKFKLTNPDEAQKFMRRYKELGREEEAAGAGAGVGFGSPAGVEGGERDRKEELGDREEEEQEEEEEEEEEQENEEVEEQV